MNFRHIKGNVLVLAGKAQEVGGLLSGHIVHALEGRRKQRIGYRLRSRDTNRSLLTNKRWCSTDRSEC